MWMNILIIDATPTMSYSTMTQLGGSIKTFNYLSNDAICNTNLQFCERVSWVFYDRNNNKYHLCCVKFKQRSWSRLSLQPPFGFFSFIFFLNFVTTNWSFSGKRDFFADEIIDLTLSRPVLESQLVFLWWTPLERFPMRKCFDDKIILPFSDVENSGAFDHDDLELLFETMMRNVLKGPVPIIIVKL